MKKRIILLGVLLSVGGQIVYSQVRKTPSIFSQKKLHELKQAADQGDAEAEAALGEAFDFGTITPQDYQKAFFWYQKAADQGNAEAQRALGAAYALGKGVPRNKEKALFWIGKAADQGDMEAQKLLAILAR